MSASRRYEILLPLQFNDGQPVSASLRGEVLLELRERFGAVTWETQIVQGAWGNAGRLCRDDLMRVIIDAPDTKDNREFFREFKERLKSRFRQVDIWMTTHLIDVI
jgi:hypothetical protein